MNDQTAGEVIQHYMKWSAEERHDFILRLQRLASYKFDSYEGFLPGERFFERLARWIAQAEPSDRPVMIGLVLERLVFISRLEMTHVIANAWPQHLRPWLRMVASMESGIPPHRVSAIEGSLEYQRLRRQTLIVGLGDGARLDVLRRNTPLSHEQFRLTPDFDDVAATKYTDELGKALRDRLLAGDALFRQVVLVDDFYGSGTSLIDEGDGGEIKGKLPRFLKRVENLKASLLSEDFQCALLLYVTSHAAASHIRSLLPKLPVPVADLFVYVLPAEVPIEDARVEGVCNRLYDKAIEDEIKGECMLGYRGVRLPVVLHHNSPNNSIALLWADTVGVEGSDNRHALFPRYERHHPDRR